MTFQQADNDGSCTVRKRRTAMPKILSLPARLSERYAICPSSTVKSSVSPGAESRQCSVPAVVMATSGYVEDLQQPSQPQGGSVTMVPGQLPDPPSAPPQFLAELQINAAAAAATPPTPTPTGQTTPPAPAPLQQAQKNAGVLATPTQPPPAQYVTAEIQSATAQPSNGQSTPQYIVVTVTGELPGH
ncbi:hypothetical protein SKAU_G00119130 [Synaphobranchus kaupii]|uniref:Uncharacterized protein n=1 Tax=Synaphobranchus kaupii TaxID=118154 RepID=A0A9Q1FNB2_SYNKA|nr:hypothetical protein SKAU_G00119130 [Synaphobranchus kaupii]